MNDIKKSLAVVDKLNESVGVTDYNPPSQGGTRQELLAKYAETHDPKDAEAARRAGATQVELQAATAEPVTEGPSEYQLHGITGDERGMRPSDLARAPKRYKLIQAGSIVASFDTVDQATQAWQKLPDNEKAKTKIRESIDGEDIPVLNEEGGTCSASIAAGPAQNLFDEPKKRVEEDEEEVDEDRNTNNLRLAQQSDYNRVLHGAMSKDEYHKKYNLGKYRTQTGKDKLAGPGGLYKNLVVGEDDDEFVGEPYRRDDEELAEDIQSAFEDYVKGKDEEEKVRVKITYNDGHCQTKLVTDKEKQRYETSSNVDKVEVVKDGAARLDDAVTEGVIDAVKGAVRKFKRGGEANKKGWEQFGKVISAPDDETADKAVRNSNRYYNLINKEKGSHTKGGFPRSVRADTPMESVLGESGGEYGVRYKVFAGREGRLTTKEKWFKTQQQLERFVAKVQETGNFYDIDGYSYPQSAEAQVEEGFTKTSPMSQERVSKDRAGMKIRTPDGEGAIVAEYKMPTFSQSVPFIRTVRVKFEDGHTEEYRLKQCKVLKAAAEEVTEAGDANPYHRVLVTLVDPNATAASRRGEKIQKHIRVNCDLADAVNKAKAFYKKKGYRVIDAEVVDSYAIAQEEAVTEISQVTKNNYIDAATGDYADANAQRQHDPDNAEQHSARMAKRQKGLAMVTGTDKDLRKEKRSAIGEGIAQSLGKSSWLEKAAGKIMGVAPEQPKYKVGQVVQYETSPSQPDWDDYGKGTGRIDSYSNGHYMINGHPINHFEIKKVVRQEKHSSISEKIDHAITELDNGPKGRVQTDKINYDARRNASGGGVSKDELEQRKAEQSAEKARNAALRRQGTRAQERQWKLEDARQEPIELGRNFDYEQMKKIASEYAGAHDIIDVTNQRNYRIKKGDAIVAGLELTVYCEYDMDDFGYDDETKASLGGENVSDAITLRFARDPQNPKKIVFTGFGA